MREKPLDALLDSIETLDVNKISGVIKRLESVSQQNPGLIFHEVDKAKHKIEAAIQDLIAAQGELQRAVGRVVVKQHRERPREEAMPRA
jgi:hypothetical protein